MQVTGLHITVLAVSAYSLFPVVYFRVVMLTLLAGAALSPAL